MTSFISGAFSSNPQFFINLNDPDPYDDITQCPVVVSLMQKQRKRKSEHAIGFKLFKCDQEAKRLTEESLRFNKSVSTDRVNIKYESKVLHNTEVT